MNFKKLLFIITFLFAVTFSVNVKAAGTIQMGINEDGTVQPMHDPALSDRYTFENDVLTLNAIDGENFAVVFVNRDITIRTKTDITFSTLNFSKNVTIESDHKIVINNTNGNGTGNLTINNCSDIFVPYINYINNLTVNNSKFSLTSSSNSGVVFNNSDVSFVSFGGLGFKSFNVNNSTLSGTGISFNVSTADNKIENSTLNLPNLNIGGPLIISNSNLNINNTIASSANLTIKDSKVNYGSGFQYLNSNLVIENSEIKSTSSSNNMLIRTETFKIKDSEIDVKNASIEGSINTECEIDNSQIKIANMDNLFINRINKSTVDTNSYNTTSIKLLSDSTINLSNGTVAFNMYDVLNSNINLDKISNIMLNNTNIVNSNLNTTRSSIYGTFTKIEKSEVLVDGNNTYAIRGNILDFKNSHLIAKGTPAFDGCSNCENLNNLKFLNSDGNDLEIKKVNVSGYDNYLFYYDDNEANYVEIKSNIKVTFKIKNGTWDNGSSDDIVSNVYAGTKLSDIILPTNMKANENFEKGVWSISINDDKLYDDIELTYTFYEKDAKEINDDVEEAEENDNIVNPKTSDKIMFFVVLFVLSIFGLVLSKKYNMKRIGE